MHASVKQLDIRMQEDFAFFFERDRDLRFQALMKEHRTRLHRFVAKYIGTHEDAAELTQQAFVSAYEAYPTFRGQSAFSTWLYGIAMNLVRNHLSRTPYRRYEFVDEGVLEEQVQGGPTPLENVELTQKIHILNHGIQQLPAAMQEVLMLVGIEELSYEQAAELLGIPVGTVRSRLSRARTQLREHMLAQGLSDELFIAPASKAEV